MRSCIRPFSCEEKKETEDEDRKHGKKKKKDFFVSTGLVKYLDRSEQLAWLRGKKQKEIKKEKVNNCLGKKLQDIWGGLNPF